MRGPWASSSSSADRAGYGCVVVVDDDVVVVVVTARVVVTALVDVDAADVVGVVGVTNEVDVHVEVEVEVEGADACAWATTLTGLGVKGAKFGTTKSRSRGAVVPVAGPYSRPNVPADPGNKPGKTGSCSSPDPST